jgi:hypothetical protein
MVEIAESGRRHDASSRLGNAIATDLGSLRFGMAQLVFRLTESLSQCVSAGLVNLDQTARTL